MSKSTKKYGPVTFSARVMIEANPKPTKKVLRYQAKLESASMQHFAKPYSTLTEKEKSDLHFKLAVAREQDREKRKTA